MVLSQLPRCDLMSSLLLYRPAAHHNRQWFISLRYQPAIYQRHICTSRRTTPPSSRTWIFIQRIFHSRSAYQLVGGKKWVFRLSLNEDVTEVQDRRNIPAERSMSSPQSKMLKMTDIWSCTKQPYEKITINAQPLQVPSTESHHYVAKNLAHITLKALRTSWAAAWSSGSPDHHISEEKLPGVCCLISNASGI